MRNKYRWDGDCEVVRIKALQVVRAWTAAEDMVYYMKTNVEVGEVCVEVGEVCVEVGRVRNWQGVEIG